MITAQPSLFETHDQKQEIPAWFEGILASLGIVAGPGWPDRFGVAIRCWLAARGHRPIKTLSLFSGGGGLDIAFHDSGFEIVEMVEIDTNCVVTLQANTTPERLLSRAKVVKTDIREYQPDPALDVEFIIGGPPCQTFSAAGRRAAGVSGTSDPRGTLFEEYVRILKTVQPLGFLFENVYGITGAEGGKPWQEIQAAFQEAGYTLSFRVLDAADYGVPQHRERLFIVGLRNERTFLFPYPTHGPDSITPRPFFPAGEAVQGVDISDASVGINGRYGNLIPDIPPGLNYSFYTKEMGHPHPVFSWRSKFSDFMYKADPSVPVRTIKAQGGQYTGPFSWENRYFTVAELKRLQTFPDAYDLAGARQACIQQIGNSVPPQLGRMLALSILNQVMGVGLPFTMHFLPVTRQLSFRSRKRELTEKYASKARIALEKPQILSPEMVRSSRFNTLEKETIRYISKNFAFLPKSSPDSSPIRLKLDLAEHGWTIKAQPDDTDGVALRYWIEVGPCIESDWPLSQHPIRLLAATFDGVVFTALWKAFDETLTELYGIADLVQLSGYYQYAPRLRARLRFNGMECPSVKWHVIQSVVHRIGVGFQTTARELGELWNIKEFQVLPLLHQLRGLGYEVRNHNTNPQIKDGCYLIPYIFPTLTPRSIQLHKRL